MRTPPNLPSISHFSPCDSLSAIIFRDGHVDGSEHPAVSCMDTTVHFCYVGDSHRCLLDKKQMDTVERSKPVVFYHSRRTIVFRSGSLKYVEHLWRTNLSFWGIHRAFCILLVFMKEDEDAKEQGDAVSGQIRSANSVEFKERQCYWKCTRLATGVLSTDPVDRMFR